MAEVSVAREKGIAPINAVSSSRRSNPFSRITVNPISPARRAELEAEGVNMRTYEDLRRETRDRRIDVEYETQVNRLRDELAEQYPMARWAGRTFTNDPQLLAQARSQRAAFNREFNRRVKRLRTQAAAAKRN